MVRFVSSVHLEEIRVGMWKPILDLWRKIEWKYEGDILKFQKQSSQKKGGRQRVPFAAFEEAQYLTFC